MIQTSFKLPCGAVLSNRIAKAAMTERLAGSNQLPNEKHIQLYKTWASQGAGMMLSGNIMIDRHHLEAAGNIVAAQNTAKKPFQKWTSAVMNSGDHFWAQLNHSGRQTNIFANLKPLSASAVKLKKLGFFAKPRAMTDSEIRETVDRFVQTALFCKNVGFTGVQFHAAHGYLINQFLSPRTNKRKDQYGGPIENRARILFEILAKARQQLGDDFPISVKLNSADFQRDGFEEKDSLFVIQRLETLGTDLLEITGGTYEDMVIFTKEPKRQSTLEREAYFLDFAKKVRHTSKIPLMLTGGFRTLAGFNKALESGDVDIIGTARPWLLNEHFPKGFLDGTLQQVEDVPLRAFSKKFTDMAIAGFYDYQISRIANQKPLNLSYTATQGIIRMLINETVKGIRNRMM